MQVTVTSSKSGFRSTSTTSSSLWRQVGCGRKFGESDGHLLRHFACSPIESTPFLLGGSSGASVKETEILTGVLEATVRDPARSGPGARLRNGATRPHFHACEPSHKDKGGCARTGSEAIVDAFVMSPALTRCLTLPAR